MSAQPAFFDVAPDGRPLLTGVRCEACGHLSHPFQSLGCEACGASGRDLASVQFTGRGTVLAVAVVHHHASDEITTPFAMASVVLEEGPAVRGVLLEAQHIPRGTPVVVTGLAVTRTVDDVPTEVIELRFAQEDE